MKNGAKKRLLKKNWNFMICSLSGKIIAVNDQKVSILQGSIGFEVSCPHAATLSTDSEITLQTYLHWNQEQGPSLYGFEKQLDKDVFILIIGCSGIGPKLGLSILQQLDSLQFLHYIVNENIDQLSKLKSIGAKKAEQLCLALRTKAPKLLKIHPQLATQTPIGIWTDLQETLTSLNYSPTEIKQTTSMLKDEITGTNPTFDQLLRKALQILAK